MSRIPNILHRPFSLPRRRVAGADRGIAIAQQSGSSHFLASAETKANVPTILEAAARENFPLAGGAYDIHILDDPQDLNRCCRQLDELRDAIDQWLAEVRTTGSSSIFTGGTKCMTAAIACSLAMAVHFSYVGGTERTKDNVVWLSPVQRRCSSSRILGCPGISRGRQLSITVRSGRVRCMREDHGVDPTLVDNNGTKRELNALKELAAVYADWSGSTIKEPRPSSTAFKDPSTT